MVVGQNVNNADVQQAVQVGGIDFQAFLDMVVEKFVEWDDLGLE